MSATILRIADKWFVSITIETEIQPKQAENQSAIGVDLGVSTLATLSNGEIITGAKSHKALLNRLKRLSCSLSRKIKGSKNREKAKHKLARLHAKIKNICQDCLHKLTTQLAKNHQVIAIEDLNVKGMMKNRHLARSVADMGFFEFKRQLQYKVALGSQEWTNLGNIFTQTTQVNEPVYLIKVKLNNQHIRVYGTEKKLQIGMVLEADILHENKKLYEWILDPLYQVMGKIS